jgi:hypothetical protein
MGALSFPTNGLGTLMTLNTKGYHGDGQNYQVTFICPPASTGGVTNANGVAVGIENTLVTWLIPGASITLSTRDLGAVVWQDVSGAASILTIIIQLANVYTLPGGNTEAQQKSDAERTTN